MVYKNVNDSLRLWCRETAKAGAEKAAAQASKDLRSSSAFLFCRALVELDFWLGCLTDADFPDYASYQQSVRALLREKARPALLRELKETGLPVILRAETAFGEKLSALPPDCIAPDIPYFRILPESESFLVKLRLSEQWAFEDNRSWYPLSGPEKPIRELFFLPADRLTPYLPRLEKLLSLPAEHLFCLEESRSGRPNCFETAELEEYQGSELLYAARDFSWLIYFSHENTVSFAGSIVPAAKELLLDENAYWDRWESG